MELGNRDFERLSAFVRDRYGINLAAKRTLIESRLAFDISRRGFKSFTAYVDVVLASPEGGECQHMINRLSTNYSFFFRDTDYVAHLKSRAVPELLAGGRRSISVWSAGCSDGQEAYSAAMVLAVMAAGGDFNFHITGTDINTEVLETARRGVYPSGELASIPEPYRRYVMKKEPDSIEVRADIRAHVSWEQGNLLDDSLPYAGCDVIFCRNVLIYFSPETRREITDRLFEKMRVGAYLYTGAMEAMDLRQKRFTYVAPSIYRKGAPR